MLRRKRILEFLKEGARTAEEIAVFFIGSSVARIPSIKAGMDAVNEERSRRWRTDYAGEYERAERLRIKRGIQELKADGLIASDGAGKKPVYEILRRGRSWLEHKKDVIPAILAEKIYAKESSDKFTIVAYDIPQSRHAYRNWLRKKLIGLGMRMLQRSVFVGRIKIPQELVTDLAEHSLLDFVEIFEITRRGTLRSSKR